MTPWTDGQRRIRARWILRSYRHWAGEDLIEAAEDDDDARARALFDAPLAVLAHDRRDDPLCIYMNAAALAAFELTLEDAAAFPTRRTAAPDDRAERSVALAGAADARLVRGYSGVRVSSTGRRFRLTDGRIWTVLDDAGRTVGQAAAFVPGPL
jgi:hypothetical protein